MSSAFLLGAVSTSLCTNVLLLLMALLDPSQVQSEGSSFTLLRYAAWCLLGFNAIFLIGISPPFTRAIKESLNSMQANGSDDHGKMTAGAKKSMSQQTMASTASITGIDKSAEGQPAKNVSGNVSDAFATCKNHIGAASSKILSYFGLPLRSHFPHDVATLSSSSKPCKDPPTTAETPFNIDVASFLSNLRSIQNECKQARSDFDSLLQVAADETHEEGDTDEEKIENDEHCKEINHVV